MKYAVKTHEGTVHVPFSDAITDFEQRWKATDERFAKARKALGE